MTAVVLAFLLPQLSASSGATVGYSAVTGSAVLTLGIPGEPVRSRPKCRSARHAVAYYRSLTWRRQEAREGDLADRTPVVRGKSCHWARYAASVHQARARSAWKALVRWRRLLANPTAAICHVFGPYCSQALRVASCESGRGIHAQNGQYLGMFQMGEYARSRYGHGYTPLEQARAAYAYFVDSGRDWSPWSCKPW